MPQNKRISLIFAFLVCICLLQSSYLKAQHDNTLKATLERGTSTVNIQQEFTYKNSSADTLSVLYFNDWAHAYSDKNTALARRFAEDFKKALHLAKDSNRGSTEVLSMLDEDFRSLTWKRKEGQIDLIRIELNEPIPPGGEQRFIFTYTVKLPPNRYTPFGYGADGGFYLKDWYLTPAVYDGEWHLYSNKNLEDLYTDNTDTNIFFTYPAGLDMGTNFNEVNIMPFPDKNYATLSGVNRKSCDIILNAQWEFIKHVTSNLVVATDIRSNKYDNISQGVSINRITDFITENLGKFPYEQLLVSEIDFNKNPLYGLSQLPSFVRPYKEQFQFELKFLKTALRSYMRETIFVDPRKEQWLTDALVNYMMIKYVDTFYPDQKLLGKLSSIWGVRNYHLAEMGFNEQYAFFNMLTARKNLDQALTTPNDSLIKFNQKIANTYKAGLGLAYLADYLGNTVVDKSVSEFYEEYSLKQVSPLDFIRILEQNTEKDISWFYDTYVSSDKRIDFKISNVVKAQDSLYVTIKNKTGTNVPISLFGIRNDTVVSEYWLTNIEDEREFALPRNTENRLVLNYDQKIPEFNQRDNWKTLKGWFSSNKKLKLQFFKDSEDPYYNQIFYMPVANFNVYDGLSPGIRFTNKTLLERPFIYDFSPSYAMREKSMVGFAKLNYRQYLQKSGLYVINYAMRASTAHFQTNSRYSTITPSVGIGWRPADLIANKRSSLVFRYVNVFRDIDPSLDLQTDPDYSVFNLRFNSINNGIIDYFSWFADAQHSADFTKLALNMEYRKLFQNNTQVNLRFFAGKFIRNQTNSDFFSFALDRPTDYLFDYNYLGRSEDSGITSQQIIIAEGGFKSQLENPFANDWIVTTNASFNLWKWIELYGDAGFIKNKNTNSRFVYDSGIRLNLVTDYFELYFPLYSNNGWEIGQPNYEERIRFLVTLSPRTLIGLFTRKWF
ncbi:metalloprotease [Lentiprolixibacter aurantiacus]|uniref:Metalloprotease n=1 Tax=Lentiprolixibacter aurantiacus TaxID=2993939 RepID=A0AAE3SNE2_9FLAO|nr:metalloprotease [Lentiprolixibacter aurantiacus]MCX2719682.1 metalloprotease [Lentiprolixibacter aurantiacus]